MGRESASSPGLPDSLTPFPPSLPTEFTARERNVLQAETTELRFAQLLEQLQESFGQRSEIAIKGGAASTQWLQTNAAVNRADRGTAPADGAPKRS